jgi:peptide deformylase
MKILRYPDPLLLQPSIDVTEEYMPDVLATVPAMTRLMRERKGAALAAVQVGILRRYCLLEMHTTTAPKETIAPVLIINPKILLEVGRRTREFEGCLSLPLFWERMERSDEILLQYWDRDFIERTVSLEGIQARAIAHEIEHFSGTLQLDKLSVMAKAMYLKKLKKHIRA